MIEKLQGLTTMNNTDTLWLGNGLPSPCWGRHYAENVTVFFDMEHDPTQRSVLIEHAAELAVAISLKP